jgi:hypothetical protein
MYRMADSVASYSHPDSSSEDSSAPEVRYLSSWLTG